MSDLQNFLSNGGDAALRRVNTQAEAAGSLFPDATWEQIGQNKQLTDFLHQSLDPNGSKYAGDTEAMKQDILNTTTARGSSVLASVWDYAKASGENAQKKRFENLISRVYEQAPNRLLSGNAGQTLDAIGAGLLGGAVYDAPLLVATGGVGNLLGLGAKGLESAGAKLLGNSATKLAATDIGADALVQAGTQLSKDATWEGVKRGAVREGAENAAFGVAGDAAQQAANMERGAQTEFSTGQAVTNALLGGVIGAGAGAVGGAFAGRAMGKELAGSLPQKATDVVFDANLPKAPDTTVVSPDFVALAEAHTNAKANLMDATGDVSEFINRVTAGIDGAKSQYTPDQLVAIRAALIEARTSDRLSETLKDQANKLTASGTPEAILKAGELEQQATAYEGLIKYINTLKFEHPDAILTNGDISPELVNSLAGFNPRLAAALGVVEQAPVPKAPKAAAAASTAAPGTTTAAAANAAPTASTAATQAAAPTPTQKVADAPVPPAPQTPTASTVTEMAATKFSDDEKAAYSSLMDILGKTDIDLQAAMTSMETNGQTQVVADIAKASGVDRGAVQEAFSKVTAATQREFNVAVAEHDAAVAAANEKMVADAAANLNQAGTDLKQAAATVADTGNKAASTQSVDGTATVTQQDVASLKAAMSETETNLNELKKTASETTAALQYETMRANLDGQVTEIVSALERGLADVEREVAANLQASNGDASFAKLTTEEKAGFVRSALQAAKDASPDLAPLIDELDPAKLTTKKGVENAKIKLRTLADDSISWTYAKAIGDILPDSLNVDDFDVVLRSVLSSAPGEEVARISNAYRGFVRDALTRRIGEIGIDNVLKDKALGPAWQRLITADGTGQKFGGVVKERVDIGKLVNTYSGDIITKAEKSDQSIVESLRKGLTHAGAVVRDTMRQLEAAGVPLDSQFMQEVLHLRAKAAVDEAIAGTFETLNKGDFEKLAKIREMRADERTRSETQSTNLHRMQGSAVGNPVVQRIYNETGEGDWFSRVVLVSGRTQVKDGQGIPRLGGPQGVLSDGISDYLGTLWAHPRKMFAAASSAYEAIHGAAVQFASWSKGSMVIDGVKISGSLKELKGLYKEKVANRMAQARMSLIVDAAERRRLPEGDTRSLTGDAYKTRVERIGQLSSPVTESEQAIAELLLDSRDRILTNKQVARNSMADILASAKDMGESAADQINAVINKLDSVLKKNGDSTMTVMRNYGLDVGDAVSKRKAGDGKEKGAPAVDHAKAKDTSRTERIKLIVREDGSVIYGTRDVNPVRITVDGVAREVVPKDAVSLEVGGNVLLFGQKVGTWVAVPGDNSAVMVVAAGLDEGGMKIRDLTKIIVRNRFRDAHAEIFKQNSGKMTEASAVTAAVPEGSQIDVEMSHTAEVKAAKVEVSTPGKLSDADLDRTMSSFDIPEGSFLVMKSATEAKAKSPGPLQGGMTVRAFARLVGISPEDIRLGSIEHTMMNNGELRGKSTSEKLNYPGIFTPIGQKAGAPNPEIVAKVAQKQENNPPMATAQRRQISMAEAEKIVLPDGRTLASVITAHKVEATSVRFDQILDLDSLNGLIEHLDKQAKLIESLAPNGVRANQYSRATAFHYLQEHLAAYPKAEITAAVDMLRRMDTDNHGLPYFVGGEINELKYNAQGDSRIALNKDAANTALDAGLPKHVVVAHEVGHWAFMNMLSPSEQVTFLKTLTKFYDADGKFNADSLMKSMPALKNIEKATGVSFDKMKRSGSNEAFAWSFTSHVLQTMEAGSKAIDGNPLWDRVVKVVKNVLSYFLGEKIDPELTKLFNKILPASISDTKFEYSGFVERATGKVGDVAAFGEKAKAAAPVIDAMQKIDTLRGRIRQHLFVPGAVADVGFAEDLRSAAKHMLGILYGSGHKDFDYKQAPFIESLRAKMNPMSDGKYRKGMVDPRELFNRSSYGKLMQAIHDVLPDGKADGVAFEAVAGAEESMAVIRSSAIGDNPEVALLYKQSYENELAGLLNAGGKMEASIEAADLFALKEAAEYAQKEFGIDVTRDLFDNGKRTTLGTAQQRDALGGAARALHDLMGDALDYMETEVRKRGVLMNKVTREVQAPDPVVSKAAEPSVARESRKRTAKVKPTTAKGVEVAAAEEAARVDGETTGVPAAADPQVQAVIARVPHRDPEQAGIIGASMHRLLAFIVRNEDGVTNADIARITGVELEDGLKADAMVSSTSEAFDALRKGFRLMSEDMTNASKKPKEVNDFIAELLINDRIDFIKEDVGDTIIRGDKTEPLNAGTLRSELGRLAKGEEVDPGLRVHLQDILDDTKHVVSGLGTTAEAKRAAGATVGTSGPVALRLKDGSYHPSLVRASVSNRLQNLPQRIADSLVEMVGLKSGVDTATTLSHNVAYRVNGSTKIFTTADEMLAKATELSGLSDEHMRNLNGEMSKAYAAGDMDRAAQALTWYEANTNAPGVTPVLLNMSKIYDPMMASDDVKAAVQAAVAASKNQKEALKSLGFEGMQQGEQITLFSQKSAKDLEQSITKATKQAKASNVVDDAPLMGEISLGLLAADGALPNPLAVEQRAILAGAPSKLAEIFSRPFKRGWSKAPLSVEDAVEVRAHHGIQLSSNSARIRKSGGSWLADKIHPILGTGMEESFTTKLSTMLNPLVKQMDKFALGESRWTNNWLGKAGYEVVRNLDIRNHAVPQSRSEARIAMAMRMNDLSHLTPDERAFAEKLNNHFEELLNLQRDNNIPVGDVRDRGNRYYLPQRFNLDWIRANHGEAVSKLAKWFEKDRAGTDAVKSSREDAMRVINEAINREELQGVLDGASSTYTQAFGDKLHQRKLHITGKDWDAVGLLFDQNLRSLVTSYSDTAMKRVEWAKTFGVRGHAAATYTDIAENGTNAAIDALMGKAGGMKRIMDHPGAENDMVARYAAMEADREVEVVSSLFSSTTSDPRIAGQLVAEITEGLKDGALKEDLVNKLVAYHVDNGGFGTTEFRKRADAIVNGLADFGVDGKTVAKTEVEFMRKMVGVLGGRPAYTIDANNGLRNAVGALKSFNSITLLGGAVLGSLADPAMSLMRSGSMKDWLSGTSKAVKIAMSDPAYIDAMHRVGVTMESVIHENLSNMSGGLTGRFNNAFFNANLLTPWTNAQRQVAALVGFESIRSNQIIALRERMTGDTGTWAYRRSMKYLRELGLGYLAESEKIGDFPSAVQDQKIAQAIHKFTNEAVFQPNRNDMPLWTQDPIASIFWQFKSYPTMMGRLAKKNFKDAISFEGGSAIDKIKGKDVGQYDGDPMGLVYLLSIGAAFGAGGAAIKETVYGKNSENEDNPHSPRSHTISKMMQEMGFKDFDLESPGADLVVGEVAHGLLALGTLGFLGDLMYQSAKSVDNGAFGRERIMSQIFGPSMGTFTDMIQVVDGGRMAMKREDGTEYGTSQERNAVRKVMKRIPMVGSVDPWVETFIDSTAGPLENPRQPVN